MMWGRERGAPKTAWRRSWALARYWDTLRGEASAGRVLEVSSCWLGQCQWCRLCTLWSGRQWQTHKMWLSASAQEKLTSSACFTFEEKGPLPGTSSSCCSQRNGSWASSSGPPHSGFTLGCGILKLAGKGEGASGGGKVQEAYFSKWNSPFITFLLKNLYLLTPKCDGLCHVTLSLYLRPIRYSFSFCDK